LQAPQEPTLRVDPRVLTTLVNIRLGRKWLDVTNTLVCNTGFTITNVRSLTAEALGYLKIFPKVN
jgi:hypothetical protein